MNYQIRSAFMSIASCACIAAIALAAFLFFKEQNKSTEEKDDETKIEETENHDEGGPRRRGGRRNSGGRNRIVRVVERNDHSDEISPERIRDEFCKALDEYRALPPEEKARWNREMQNVRTQFMGDGRERVLEEIENAPPERMAEIQRDFGEMETFMEQNVFAADLHSCLLPEEEATVGAFLDDIGSVYEEVRDAIYSR